VSDDYTNYPLILRTFIERRTEIDTTWRWRDRHGERHAPDQMETRHIFHTLKMIWNNMVPREYHVGHNVRLYNFGPHYTKDYMVQAVYQMGHQLAKRSLTAEQMEIMRQMYSYFTAMRMLTCSP
jgi:hypothetical protein